MPERHYSVVAGVGSGGRLHQGIEIRAVDFDVRVPLCVKINNLGNKCKEPSGAYSLESKHPFMTLVAQVFAGAVEAFGEDRDFRPLRRRGFLGGFHVSPFYIMLYGKILPGINGCGIIFCYSVFSALGSPWLDGFQAHGLSASRPYPSATFHRQERQRAILESGDAHLPLPMRQLLYQKSGRQIEEAYRVQLNWRHFFRIPKRSWYEMQNMQS